MAIEYKIAPSKLAAEYIELRGLTRENPITKDALRSYGITAESWAQDIESEKTRGFIALSGAHMVGYCFADIDTGEVLVLAVLPAYEGQGIGRRLLGLVIELFKDQGYNRLLLGCSPDANVRSHGFYRHLGWHSTGSLDKHGDEILELRCA
jgi:GNAT superfamily N-acetyltransferase